MIRIFIAIFLMLQFLQINAQDTLTVMHYNLLNYGNITSYCDETNNNLSDKNTYLKTISDYIKPDILSVNEISKLSINYNQILDSVLNSDNTSDYERVQYTNGSNSDIINMVYFNKKKISLKSQERIITSVRDINLYNFYYNNQGGAISDTVFFTCISAHLKAGSTSADEDERAQMTLLLMNYLNTNRQSGNFLVMGDFNLYSNTEEAFQNLINYTNASFRFYDPINKMGNWSDNSNYSLYHTQSTHSTSNNCAASGGLDDRFDFILTSYSVLEGLNNVAYIPNSYKTIGQDGLHLNKSLTNGTNNSAPQNVINALYNMSDHLPVVLKLKVTGNQIGVSKIENNISMYSFENDLIIQYNGDNKLKYSLQLISPSGQVVFSEQKNLINRESSISFSHLKSGLYFAKLVDSDGNLIVKKFFIK